MSNAPDQGTPFLNWTTGAIIDDRLVVGSGVLLCEKNSTVKLELMGELVISIFFEDREDKEKDIRLFPVDEKTAELHLINFESAFGTGLKKSMKIADLRGGSLFMNFRVSSHGSAHAKELVYTFTFAGDLDGKV